SGWLSTYLHRLDREDQRFLLSLWSGSGCRQRYRFRIASSARKSLLYDQPRLPPSVFAKQRVYTTEGATDNQHTQPTIQNWRFHRNPEGGFRRNLRGFRFHGHNVVAGNGLLISVNRCKDLRLFARFEPVNARRLKGYIPVDRRTVIELNIC